MVAVYIFLIYLITPFYLKLVYRLGDNVNKFCIKNCFILFCLIPPISIIITTIWLIMDILERFINIDKSNLIDKFLGD